MEDLPSTERGPRQSDDSLQTGTGAPRSADQALPREVATRESGDDVSINRSGSGGSGGPQNETMDELLGGDPEDQSI